MLMNKLPDIGYFYEWNNDVVFKFDRKTSSITLNQKEFYYVSGITPIGV
jgi:hypothetical protein